MAKGGVWGDNMEIVAFAASFNIDVRIYMAEYTYMIPGQGEEAERGCDDGSLRITIEVQRHQRNRSGYSVPKREELSPRFMALLPLMNRTRKLKLVMSALQTLPTSVSIPVRPHKRAHPWLHIPM